MQDFDSETLNSMSSIDSSGNFSQLSLSSVYSPERLTLKPHRSSDSTWQAIRAFSENNKNTTLGIRDFRLVHQVGSGDIGRVFLCLLRDGGEEAVYSMKVVDREVAKKKMKTDRAEMEKRILRMVDHPFLPTLFAEFEVERFSCVVMEYCDGGDLHSLRYKQPHKRFSLSAARFYAAEVLIALEYLHMLGIIYRDLKPENVLVRSDGHIMLSDFDLSFCSDSISAVESPISSPDPATPKIASPSSTLTPFSCLSNHFFRSKKIQTLPNNRLFVAEPITAKSSSFVGTHEYVAPEVASGKSHGNAVDWWAYGVFIYEMIYGRTPFASQSNEATLRSIVKNPLVFPTDLPASTSEMHARDLITKLLVKDPLGRVGAKRGAVEIKTHQFFKSLNFALVRSLVPPVVPSKRPPLQMKKLEPFDLF